jgi:hypothetical protein
MLLLVIDYCQMMGRSFQAKATTVPAIQGASLLGQSVSSVLDLIAVLVELHS